MQKKKFLCTGVIMADILATGLEKFPEHWEETVQSERVVLSPGGGAANSAIAFACLGAAVDLLGKIGIDYLSDFLEAGLLEKHVGTAYLSKTTRKNTGVALGLVHKNGKRCFVTEKGANECLAEVNFMEINLSVYHTLLINGFFQFSSAENTILAFTEKASAQGITIGFDMASWDSSGRWMQALLPFLPWIDYFFTNDAQLEQLTGEASSLKGAKYLLSLGVDTVIVKLGARGCEVIQEALHIKIPAPDLPVVDTTGAGDSFDAAYLLGIEKGWTHEVCARFANVVAGLNCGKYGATGGVPEFEEALEAVKKIYAL